MKKTQENIVFTQKHPTWLDTVISNNAFDNDLFQIILFYVFYSPCPKYSTQGRTLQYYGWNDKPWKTNRYLKDKLNGDLFGEKNKYFRATSQISELPESFHKADLEEHFYEQRKTERVAFLNCESNEYISLFHHIRCALAHGRIAMFEDGKNQDIIFVMENGCEKGKDFQVKARMVLRKSTLLHWAKIITDGPQEPERDYHREVFQALLVNNRLRRKDLISMFQESEYVINKALEYLKKSHLIVYQNHGKNSWWDIYADNAEKYFAKAERTE